MDTVLHAESLHQHERPATLRGSPGPARKMAGQAPAVTRPAEDRMRIWPPIDFERWPLPRTSSTRITSPHRSGGLAVAGGDLHAAIEVDDVLPPRRRMPAQS